MCWHDFCEYFDEVGVCDPMYIPKSLLQEGQDFPDICHTHIKTVGSEWKPGVNAGGRPVRVSVACFRCCLQHSSTGTLCDVVSGILPRHQVGVEHISVQPFVPHQG
jgi:hypothetical protein